MGTLARPPATKRAFRQYSSRRTAFVPAERAPTVRPILENAGTVERVYLVGPAIRGGTAGVRAWASDLPDGWAGQRRGHYLEGANPVLRFEGPHGRLEVLRAAQWWGEGPYLAADAAAAWRVLADELERGFGRGATMFASPGATG